MGNKISCNRERILARLEQFGSIGATEHGGVNRHSFSKADQEARRLLLTLIKERKLKTQIDPIGNILAKREGLVPESPSILLGSHIDSVPNGGKFDGMLGVIIALEIIDMLIENNITTNHPVELISFSGEEPNPYGLSTLGSRTFVGKLKFDDLINVIGTNNDPLKVAVKRVGGNLEKLKNNEINLSNYRYYLELHIEQGRRLEKSNTPVGIVTDIVGIYRDKVCVIGESNHAGTTSMQDRKDSLTAAAFLIQKFEEICLKNDIVGTIGWLEIAPNAVNVIPGETNFIMELRSADQEKIYLVKRELTSCIEQIQSNRNVIIEVTNILDQAPITMSNKVISSFQDSSEKLSTKHTLLPSFAGHDASHMADVSETGMIFIPSKDGKSHCPEEYSAIEDIAKATEVMFSTVLSLDQQS